MVATQSLRDELAARGFRNIRPWSRGVDLDLFKPEPREDWGLPRPVFLYVGRVAVEKNIGAFLDLDLPGRRSWSATGRSWRRCSATIPAVRFTGPRYGEALARAYAGADVFVFPQPDRHVRPGAAGGAGLRHAGGGVSGDRADGRAGRRGGQRSAR